MFHFSSQDFFAAARRIAETLLYAAIGGIALGLAGLPAGWLSGAILTVAIAAFAGRPLLVPSWLTRGIFILIGISLGAVVTPQTLHGMASYPASIVTLIAAMVCVSVAGTCYLYFVHGWALPTAYLSSSPGGLSQVMVVANDIGADLRAIAIVQSMRVVIIALGLPAGLALFGVSGHAVRHGNGPLTMSVIDDLAILVAVSTVAALVAYKIRFPGGLLFGAMFASAALHGSAMVHAVVPPWVANCAMVALGAVIGARFTNTPVRLLANFMTAAFGSFAVAVTVAALFAVGVTVMLSLNVSDVMIAFAPGSVDAMMLLAIALHLDPVYVGAHHVSRVIFVSLVMPLVARRLAQVTAVPPEPPQDKPEDAPDEPPRPRPTFQD